MKKIFPDSNLNPKGNKQLEAGNMKKGILQRSLGKMEETVEICLGFDQNNNYHPVTKIIPASEHNFAGKYRYDLAYLHI